ncbi:7-carboxy-7-deazaguanine synthase QueE [Flammeovirga kamogawensis]|uniref:7-carboxy-7-deazaguanine synthase n=1 Tax=Flammeovirga kamogawensis TaxID=373891 RepID=A0ABX8GWU1_9BACT|nr:7-carboxy-7-deazaguanine synthase QueE [Flammeovirga kamogawensis]MBB6460686.1 organic radical activating enzyme [Flammeovirga kamogawensis]QWG08041.1 7-carboxy-7-deazaguanine synthase QueE [Flammeovirga kamogawensis]TRX69848.1 7-carboxy-7-deazaguanine synthase QueE [Flammeovirga kamogawensis]
MVKHLEYSTKERVQLGYALPVMEAFYTIQGEGSFSGHAAYFIRLAGCDVGCVWCDVKESWEQDKHPILDIEEIIQDAKAHPGRLAIITGGEPLMHELGPLTKRLKEEGFQINIETSGTHKFTGEIDYVCLSPKKFKAPVEEAYKKADEFKVVVFHKSDLQWAIDLSEKLNPNCKLYIQPEWSKRNTVTPLLVEFVKENPEWHLSLQTHKYIDIP